MENFNELSLPSELLKALEALTFTKPTGIQEKAIPAALSGKDLIGCAQTGSGKTLAFSIPLIARLLANPTEMGLILTPTRELALQISVVFRQLAEHMTRFRGVLVIGGESMGSQIRYLAQKPQIIVATPGRLCDHINRGTVNLAKVSYLVLDEADRMLDMGFAPQLNMILEELPKVRQTLLFSATMPPDIQRMAAKYLNQPTRIDVGAKSEGISPQIKQRVVHTTVNEKGNVLLDEIKASNGVMIIFARTKIRTERVARLLHTSGVSATLIHGDRTQGQRRRAIEGFRRGEFKILVATDIAARGIDVPSITHVINFDLPQCPEDYVHRIGRTGRAGATGEAISFLTSEDREMWGMISRLMNKTTEPQGPNGSRPQSRGPSRFGGGNRKRSSPGRFNGGGGGSRPGNGSSKPRSSYFAKPSRPLA